MDKRHLRSARHVIGALGGIGAVAELTGSLRTAVHNWRAAKRFPASVYKVMTEALAERGATAPAALWSQKERRLDIAA
ncbi:MAG TPA: hypothetical protein VNM70_10805 [Burkholderiales bacterium]|nr:hypothetical protein [Burkholderiales bacterium]